MTFRSQLKVAEGRIDPAPMVDVVFLLLIFFMLSSSFVLQPGIRVDLQPSNIRSASPFQGLVVTVTREGIYFNDLRMNIDGLKKAFEVAVKRSPDQELVIKADRLTPHGTVVEIMGMAIEAGIPAVNIATRPVNPATNGKEKSPR